MKIQFIGKFTIWKKQFFISTRNFSLFSLFPRNSIDKFSLLKKHFDRDVMSVWIVEEKLQIFSHVQPRQEKFVKNRENKMKLFFIFEKKWNE